jgi:hypothetical protein
MGGRVVREDEVYVSEIKDLPADEHYAVLVNDSFSYNDGYDEGPGRSASYSTHRNLQYIAFRDIEKLKDWILKNDNSSYRKEYKIVRVKTLTVSKQVTIGID